MGPRHRSRPAPHVDELLYRLEEFRKQTTGIQRQPKPNLPLAVKDALPACHRSRLRSDPIDHHHPAMALCLTYKRLKKLQ
jgi:hypothetical protein